MLRDLSEAFGLCWCLRRFVFAIPALERLSMTGKSAVN
jgi:hypothetical protein